MKKAISYLIIFVGIILAAFLYLNADYQKSLREEVIRLDSTLNFEVNSGESSKSVANRLRDEGVISTKQYYYFIIYLRQTGTGSSIQAGNYQIEGDYSIKSLINTLGKAVENQIWIKVSEGTRKDEIAEEIAMQLADETGTSFDKEIFLSLTNDAEFISTLNLNVNSTSAVTDLEGFLFPDTYLIPVGSDESYIIKKLADTFNQKVEEISYEELIIASLVEREGVSDTDKPIIAGIIKKRLDEGWLLNIDATLLYPKKDWKYTLTRRDLAEDNQYNTYTRKGLPPTPICNPSLSSITHTLFDKDSVYYYYIHSPDGQAHFARTLTEHNNNINEYLR